MLELSVMLPIYREDESAIKTIEEVRQYSPQSHLVIGYTPHKIGVGGLYLDTELDTYLKRLSNRTLIYVYKRGKGLAVQKMLQACPISKYTIMMDSDYTYSAWSIPVLLYELELMSLDAILGWRKKKERGSMTPTNRVGNWCLSSIASILYRQRVHDVCTGMWGFTGSIVPYLSKTCTRENFTIEAEMFSRLKKSGIFRVGEAGIMYRPRLEGTQAKLKVSDGFRIGACLIKERLRR